MSRAATTFAELSSRAARIDALIAHGRRRTLAEGAELDRLSRAHDLHFRRLPGRIVRARRAVQILETCAALVGLAIPTETIP